jgi:hypothetical protein
MMARLIVPDGHFLSYLRFTPEEFWAKTIFPVQQSRDFPMKTKSKEKHNYVDALETEHLYAVLTKPGRIQILVHPTAKQLRKRGKKGWCLSSTVDNGAPGSWPGSRGFGRYAANNESRSRADR